MHEQLLRPSKHVPSITVGRTSYLSDRFYLLRPLGDLNVQHGGSSCTCGALNPPPLLDKNQFIASLDLRAAILGTYTLDLSFVRRELPTLFGGVPTLVLHGHKGLKERVAEAARKGNKKHALASKFNKVSQKRVKLATETNALDSLESSDEDGSQHLDEQEAANTVLIKQDDESPPEEGWLNSDETLLENDELPSSLPHNFHMTQVLPTWLPTDAPVHSSWSTKEQQKATQPDHLIVIDSDDEHEQKGVHPDIVKARLKKRGVHHPKFMVLFERSGSVIVMITTSNLTEQTSVDGAWVQRFEPADSATKKGTMKCPRADGSDFGYVLANFLQHQSNAASEGDLLPEEFLFKYCGLDGFDNFRKHYRFQDSQVHLIAHVPGDHKGRHTLAHLGKNFNRKQRSFLFGPQRVSDIVERLSESGKHGKAWIPEWLHSEQDRLIVQTTSFGGYWTRENMTLLVQSYFGCETFGTSLEGGCDEGLLNQMDIIWPTMKFMKNVYDQWKPNRLLSPEYGVAELDLDTTIDQPAKDEVVAAGFVFLSSTTFNTIDIRCISRLSTYETSNPNPLSSIRAPHFKSYIRLLGRNREQLGQEYGEAEENFSWFLLTSACLSRGAQGKPTPMRSFESDEMTYSNFELGVLFCSRLQGDRQADRLYCSIPKVCCCGKHSRSKSGNLIHLPIPYSLRAKKYQTDEDDADLCFTPYFHEIPQGTGCVGQMKLTPLGAQLAADTRLQKN